MVEDTPSIETIVTENMAVEIKTSTGGWFSPIGAVSAIVVVAVALVVGAFVIAQLSSSLVGGTSTTIINGTTKTTTSGPFNSMLNGNQTAAFNQILSGMSGAYNLIVVALIVLAAVAILATIIEGLGGGFRFRK